MTAEHGRRTIPVLGIVTGIGTVAFWTAFFTVGLAPTNPPACYLTFERAIPVADIPLALALVIGGILALKGSATGRRLLAVAGGAQAYVGLLDISFNYQNGIYSLSVTDMLVNGFINLWCLVLGIVLAVKMK